MFRKAAICLIILMCTALDLPAQTDQLLLRPYTPVQTEGTVGYFLEDISKQAGVELSYSSAVVDLKRSIRLRIRTYTVEQVLGLLLQHQQVEILVNGGQILLVAKTGPEPAKDYTIYGYIRDADTKEILIGAIIYAPGTGLVTASNEYGYYSLTLPVEAQRIVVSYVGYTSDTIPTAAASTRKDVALNTAGSLEEVVVSDQEGRYGQGGYYRLVPGDIEKQQALLGEQDVLRSLQYIPGVQSTLDGGIGVMVRGGDPGQNLNLLDGSPLYFVDHFFGVTSVYNTDAIKSVDFHKGAFPSRYGGRLSSVIDVHTRDGDMERYGGQFTMGLVKSSLTLEGPLIKNKASVMLSGRRTWIDGLWRPFDNAVGVDFYDVNLKANYILNRNNRFFLSLYSGRDQIRLQLDETDFRVRWRNFLGSLRWNTILSSKAFLHTNLSFSDYRFRLNDRRIDFGFDTSFSYIDYNGSSGIRDATLRSQLQWYPGGRHKLQAGLIFALMEFVPTAIDYGFLQSPQGINTDQHKEHAKEISVYAEDEIRLHDRWKLRAGFHVSNWFSDQFQYTSFQPRLYTSWRMAPDQYLHFSLTRMSQFLHLVSTNTVGLPTDFWVPGTARLKPENAWLTSIGLSGIFKGINYQAEGYSKMIDGATQYTSGGDIFENSEQWQYKLSQGRGWSYGAELGLNKAWGPFEASLAYTLAWNWRQFDDLNGGERFPHRYDRRHNLKIGLIYQPVRNFDLAASWLWMSGEAITLPDQVYPDLDNNLGIGNSSGLPGATYTYHYADWNGYRLPPIHRLDLGANFRKYGRGKYVRTWSIGVFNAYARNNILFVDLQANEEGNLELSALSFLRFVPYVTYKMEF